MVLPNWIYSTTKWVLLGVGFIFTSEYAWCKYKNYIRKKQDVTSKSIAEVLFFSEECKNCENHENSNKPCSLASCPLRNLNKITAYLDTATRSVDVCVYLLNYNSIIKAIIDLQKRNVIVRVIINDESSGNGASQILNMRRAGIKVRFREPEYSYLMHHKFVIVDQKLLITGSANWTKSAFYGNSENILITNHSEFIVQYMREFEELWLEFNVNSSSNGDRLLSISQRENRCTNNTSSPIAEVLFFSKKSASCQKQCANLNVPCNSASCSIRDLNEMIGYIQTATRSLDVCVYMLTYNPIVQAIIDLQRKDVFVRLISDNGSCGNDASQVSNMQEAGISVGYRKSTYFMHHKFVIVDKKLLINGSANWTKQAFHGNYENILITNYRDIVVQYVTEFDKLWLKFSDEANIDSSNNVKKSLFGFFQNKILFLNGHSHQIIVPTS